MAVNRNEQLITHARENFGAMSIEVLWALKVVADKGRPVYGPAGRANDPNCFDQDSWFLLEPRNQLDGRLYFKEMKALLMVHAEVGVLSEVLDYGENGAFDPREVLGLTDEQPGEVLRGMADFVQNLGFVAGARERLNRKEKEPWGTTTVEGSIRIWNQRFKEKIEADGPILGVEVAGELVKMFGEAHQRRAVDEATLKIWEDYCLGLELAAQLYLDSLGLGSASNS